MRRSGGRQSERFADGAVTQHQRPALKTASVFKPQQSLAPSLVLCGYIRQTSVKYLGSLADY
jgi:hypothetical protein